MSQADAPQPELLRPSRHPVCCPPAAHLDRQTCESARPRAGRRHFDPEYMGEAAVPAACRQVAERIALPLTPVQQPPKPQERDPQEPVLNRQIDPRLELRSQDDN